MTSPIALITGAGQGIGRGIALALAAEGYDIVANDIIADPTNCEKGLYELTARVNESGQRCLPVQGDISNCDDHVTILEAALAEFGAVDLLVNNAGVAPRQRLDILEATAESFDRVMSINARGPYFLTQLIARQMIKQQQQGRAPGMIIFSTSISADVSSTSRGDYCISKSALSMAARLYADRLAEFGICVYEIRPGIIATDMTSAVKEKYDKMIAEGLVPQRRWGYPEDIGKAVVGLAKGYFGYSTGAIIEIGGGMGIPRL